MCRAAEGGVLRGSANGPSGRGRRLAPAHTAPVAAGAPGVAAADLHNGILHDRGPSPARPTASPICPTFWHHTRFRVLAQYCSTRSSGTSIQHF